MSDKSNVKSKTKSNAKSKAKSKVKSKDKSKQHLDNCDIINFDGIMEGVEDDRPFTQNDFRMFQHPFNAIVCGKTGCGKGNLLSNCLFRFLHYDKLYVYAKQINQEKYDQIQTAFEDIPDKLVMSDDIEDIIGVQDLDKSEQSIIIIDDMVAEKNQSKIIDLWISGRHGNASCIYLTQLYTAVPRPIRLNTHYIVLYKTGNRKELSIIFQELGDDIEKDKFIKLYQEATSGKFNFFLVDKLSNEQLLKYRMGFDCLCIC
jgi:Cdc6-like AAA superfamily ATPase